MGLVKWKISDEYAVHDHKRQYFLLHLEYSGYNLEFQWFPKFTLVCERIESVIVVTDPNSPYTERYDCNLSILKTALKSDSVGLFRQWHDP